MQDDKIAFRYREGATLPDGWVTWDDAAGDLIPFASDPHTFSLAIESRDAPGTLIWIKTLGFTGYDTDPNLRIAWTDIDLGLLTPGRYAGDLTGTRQSDNGRRKLRCEIEIERSPGSAVDTGPTSPPD